MFVLSYQAFFIVPLSCYFDCIYSGILSTRTGVYSWHTLCAIFSASNGLCLRPLGDLRSRRDGK